MKRSASRKDAKAQKEDVKIEIKDGLFSLLQKSFSLRILSLRPLRLCGEKKRKFTAEPQRTQRGFELASRTPSRATVPLLKMPLAKMTKLD